MNKFKYHKLVIRKEFVYHFLGNGLIQTVVQVNEDKNCYNALVLYLMDPDRFTVQDDKTLGKKGQQKYDTFFFHEELGPEPTCVSVESKGRGYVPNPQQIFDRSMKYGMSFKNYLPAFWARYPAKYTPEGKTRGSCFDVEEKIFCPIGYRVMLRQITVRNSRGLKAEDVNIIARIVPNQRFFPMGEYDNSEDALVMGEKDCITISSFARSNEHAICKDREKLNVRMLYRKKAVKPGEAVRVRLIYAYGSSKAEALETTKKVKEIGYEKIIRESREYWRNLTGVKTGIEKYDNLYLAACNGIKAAVSKTGKMNAGIWQYNQEWVRDSCMVALGAIMTGQFKEGKKIIDRLMNIFVDFKGRTSGEGEWYAPSRAELDMNGEMLYTLWTYWVYTDDDSLIKKHWGKLRMVAEYPLNEIFWSKEAGMIHNEREMWERDFDRYGIEDGFEIETQLWVSLGLTKIAEMAEYMGEKDNARKWSECGKAIWRSLLGNKKYKLVEDGHFIKRRKLDGEVQRCANLGRVLPASEAFDKQELEPDSSEALPMAYRLIDGKGELSLKTLEHLQRLWNQDGYWDIGGYSRYNIKSEPDSPGPWTLSTLFIARAALEARQYGKVVGALDWMLETYGGKGYTWPEYLDRNPELQRDVGFTPWNSYAELSMLFVFNMLGFHPGRDKIEITPNVLPGTKGLRAKVKFRGYAVGIDIRGWGKPVRALMNGEEIKDIGEEGVRMGVPTSNANIEILLEERG